MFKGSKNVHAPITISHINHFEKCCPKLIFLKIIFVDWKIYKIFYIKLKDI